jgi:hypothetical protein
MSDVGEPERRWGQSEVSLILQRAMELQDEEQPSGPHALARPEDGASLAELEQMANEVGIDRALVRRAVAELESRPRRVPISPWTGGPGRIVFERVLPTEVSPAAIESLLPILQSAFSGNGQGSMVGRTFTWTSLNRGGREAGAPRLSISVISRAGGTTIRAEERLWPAQVLVGFIGSVFPAMYVGGTLHSPLAGVATWLLTACSAHLGARALYRREVRKRTEALQELFAHITAHLQSALDEPTHATAHLQSALEEPALPAATKPKASLPPGRRG